MDPPLTGPPSWISFILFYMAARGRSWPPVAARGRPWPPVAARGRPRPPVAARGRPWAALIYSKFLKNHKKS